MTPIFQASFLALKVLFKYKSHGSYQSGKLECSPISHHLAIFYLLLMNLSSVTLANPPCQGVKYSHLFVLKTPYPVLMVFYCYPHLSSGSVYTTNILTLVFSHPSSPRPRSTQKDMQGRVIRLWIHSGIV